MRFAVIEPNSSTLDSASRTVDCVISVGSPVQRSFGREELEISNKAIDLDRVQAGLVPVLDSHQQGTVLGAHLGRLSAAWIEGGALKGRITFDATERGDQAMGMVARNEVRGISAGYSVQQWQISDDDGNVIDPERTRISLDYNLTFTARRWTLLEVSVVSVPADPAATIRSADQADIGRKQMLDSMSRSKQMVKIIRDEREGVAEAMEIALTSRILGSQGYSGLRYKGLKSDGEQERFARFSDQAKEYMGLDLVEIAARSVGYRGRGGVLTASDKLEIFSRAFQSTSDFPNIFQNSLNKALQARYELATPTYRETAVERPFKDFRPHPQVRAGDFPQLQPVLETGELQHGTSQDNGELVSISPHGVIFTISRQMLVNDDLGAIDQILADAAGQVLVFENTTFFNMFNSNPTLAQNGNAVFSSGNGNLAASGAAPSVSTVSDARKTLRGMKSLSGQFLNVPASFILTGPEQETAADQIVTAITPTLTSSVNPYSGRLRSISDANISDTSWYLGANPSAVPCFIYGFLNGASGPRTRIDSPFGQQGVKVSLEHDFGVGAIDYRGFYRNPGA
ncbi:phage head maturation protease [Bradyrhizobium sp. USDA 4448]